MRKGVHIPLVAAIYNADDLEAVPGIGRTHLEESGDAKAVRRRARGRWRLFPCEAEHRFGASFGELIFCTSWARCRQLRTPPGSPLLPGVCFRPMPLLWNGRFKSSTLHGLKGAEGPVRRKLALYLF